MLSLPSRTIVRLVNGCCNDQQQYKGDDWHAKLREDYVISYRAQRWQIPFGPIASLLLGVILAIYPGLVVRCWTAPRSVRNTCFEAGRSPQDLRIESRIPCCPSIALWCQKLVKAGATRPRILFSRAWCSKLQEGYIHTTYNAPVLKLQRIIDFRSFAGPCLSSSCRLLEGYCHR